MPKRTSLFVRAAAMVVAAVLLFPAAGWASELTRSDSPDHQRQNLPRRKPIVGPTLGLVHDSQTSTIRPVIGVVGAALVGDPLDLGVPIVAAAVSPRGEYVLALIGDERRLLIMRPRHGAKPRNLDVPMGADEIVLSPRSRSAAILYRAEERALIVRGLPGNPSIGADINLGGTAAVLATNDSGTILVAALIEGTSSAVMLHGIDGASRYLAQMTEPSAISFSPDGRDVVISDRGADEVWLFRNIAGTPESHLLASGADRISRPVGAAMSRNGKLAVIANGGSRTISVLDLTGGDRREVACNCAPTGVEEFGSNVFRLTSVSDGLVWLFDARGVNSAVRFVPLAQQKPTDKSLGYRVDAKEVDR
jgi:hypothetical protein